MPRKKNVKDFCYEDELLISEKMNGNGKTYTSQSPLNYKADLKCKNEKQKEFYNLIKEKEIVFCVGSAGSGKSYIGLTAALELIKNPELPYKNITIIVQTVQSELEVGFLKGTISDKLEPFLEPYWYTIKKILRNSGNNGNSQEILDELIRKNYITYNHVAFLRGVNIDNSVVLIDESQQYSKSAMKTILTRIGSNSKYIFMGDIEQCDNKELKKSKEENGLKFCMNAFKDMSEIGTIEFTNDDIVRNPIIGKLLKKFH